MKIFILSVMILYINFEVYKEMEKVIDNVNVKANKKLSDNEIKNYIHKVMKLDKGILTTLDISIDNDNAELEYTFHNQHIYRIRRITGYLTGTVDCWNNAKKAELRDRVKHA